MEKFDEKLIYLIKKNEYIIGFEDHSTKLVQRLPLSSRRYKEITKLAARSYTSTDEYFNTHKNIIKYCLDINDDEFDSIIWESTSELETQKDIYGIRKIV